MAKWPVLNCCPIIPHRGYVCIIAFLGLTISYIMRFCFSMALTEMAQAPRHRSDPDACPFPKGAEKKFFKVLEFNWTEHEQGLVHSSFFWGYAVTQIPGGMLAERIGPKVVLVSFVGGTSLMCILSPTSARLFGHIGLMVVRILLGLCQGFVYASLHLVVAWWVPKSERGTWGTLVFSGAHAGNALNNFFTGYILYWFPGKWELVFYIWGTLGAIWVLVFAFTTFAFPDDHVNMKPKERAILDAYLKEVHKEKNTHSTPWKDIMTSMPVWAIIIAMIGHDWGLFALVSDVPKYIKSVLHYNVKQNGMINASIYLTIWALAVSSGLLVDYLEKKQILRTINSRKIGTTIASVGPSIGLIGAAYTGCNLEWAVTSLCMGMGTMGFFYPSLKVNPIDLSTNYAATLGALGHGIGALSGIAVPYLVGVLTPNSFLSEWRLVFWITFGVMTITNIFYIIFASSDLQPWNTPKHKDEEGTTA